MTNNLVMLKCFCVTVSPQNKICAKQLPVKCIQGLTVHEDRIESAFHNVNTPSF